MSRRKLTKSSLFNKIKILIKFTSFINFILTHCVVSSLLQNLINKISLRKFLLSNFGI